MKKMDTNRKRGGIYKIAEFAVNHLGLTVAVIIFFDVYSKILLRFDWIENTPCHFFLVTLMGSMVTAALTLIIAGATYTKCNYPCKEELEEEESKDTEQQILEELIRVNNGLNRIAETIEQEGREKERAYI